MSQAEIFKYIAIVCYALAGISFVIAVYYTFSLKIKTTINELSGKSRQETTSKMVASYATTGTLRKSGMTDILNESEEMKKRQTGKVPKSGPLTGSTNAFVYTKDVVVVNTNKRVE